MGVIEDVRKVMQDFLAPELHAIREKLGAIESGQRELRAEMLRLFDKAEQDNKTRYRELVTAMSLEARVRRVEEKEAESSDLLANLAKEFFSGKQPIDSVSSRPQRQEPDPKAGTE